jgi:hypothetical protein
MALAQRVYEEPRSGARLERLTSGLRMRRSRFKSPPLGVLTPIVKRSSVPSILN